MGASTILPDLVVVIVVAAASTIVSHRLRQPVVLGYLVAGVLVGPATPFVRLVHDTESIHALAELGVIFLMVSLGLEFHLARLREVGARALVVAGVQIAAMVFLGFELGSWLGWSRTEALFLGVILAVSSTLLVVKLLMERGEAAAPFAALAFGVLIVEDVFSIVVVALLGGLGTGGDLDPVRAMNVVAGVALFALVAVGVGIVLVPRLVDRVSRFGTPEVLVMTILGVALGGAFLAESLGFSAALGAFLAGAVLAESRAAHRVADKVQPLRDLFTAVFFVAVGMLLDPAFLLAEWRVVLAVTGVVIVGKTVVVTLAALATGHSPATSVRTGASLAQIGEFSFVIAGLALALGLVGAHLYQIAIAASALTALVSPFLVVASAGVAARLEHALPRPLVRHPHSTGPASAHAPRPRVARVLVYAAWLVAVVVAGAFASAWLGGQLHATVEDDVKRAGGLVVISVIAIPFAVAFAKSVEQHVLRATRERDLHPARLRRAHASLRARVGPRTLAALLALAAAGVLLALALRAAWSVHVPELPRPALLAPALALVALAAAGAWRSGRRVHAWMEETLDTLLGDERAPARPSRPRARAPGHPRRRWAATGRAGRRGF